MELGPWASLALWGDSAPSHKKDQVYLLSWRLLNGSCRKRFWIACFGKRQMCQCGCFGRHTLDTLFKVVAWSFRALLAGIYPAVDHDNQPFAHGTYRAALAGKPMKTQGAVITKIGDWQWMKAALNLKSWRGEGPSLRACWLCKAAKRGAIFCYDFSAGAAWRRHRLDNAAYMEEHHTEGSFLSPIFQIPGFRLEFCRPDWMHCCCLGIVRMCSGSVMFELFRQVGGTTNNHRRACGILVNMMKTASKAMHVSAPFDSLSLGMIRHSLQVKPSFNLKAAEGRYFLPVLHYMLTHMFDCTTRRQHLRLTCVKCLVDMYEEIKDENWRDDRSPMRLVELTRAHCIQYNALREGAEDELLWCLVPKHHLMFHVIESTRGNPKLEWCYGDEDCIGDCANLARSCNPLYIPSSLIEKYRRTFEL